MRFQRVIEQVYFRPWYITPTGHASIRRLVESRIGKSAMPFLQAGADYEEDEDILDRIDSDGIKLSDIVSARPSMRMDRDGVAHIHILGPIGKGLSRLERACGLTGVEQVTHDLDIAEAEGARAVMLHVNSPGGTITGVPELAERIAAFDGPVLAYTDDLMASAAYFLSAGADMIVASESADVGSIGVFIPWVDFADALAEEGLRPDPIVNTGGDLKAIGFTGRLSEAHRQALQEDVDHSFERFQGHVLSFRAVDPSAMRGWVMSGDRALAANLVDFVGTEADAYQALLDRIGRG